MGNKRFLALLSIIAGFICTTTAMGQDPDRRRFELFLGYSHNRVDVGPVEDFDPGDDIEFDDIFDEREGFNGFNASVVGNFSRYLGAKFDYSYHQKSFGFGADNTTVRLHNILGGIQVKDNSTEGTFKPFAHALIGGAHVRNRVTFTGGCVAIVPSPCPNFTDSETGLAGAVGGGIDIRASNKIDIRVIQFDYNPTRVFDSTQHNFRIGVGIVFH